MEFWSSGAFFFVEQINFTYLSIFASTFPKLYNKAASKPQCILISFNWPKFSDFFDLCLYWVSVVRGTKHDDARCRNLIGDNPIESKSVVWVLE